MENLDKYRINVLDENSTWEEYHYCEDIKVLRKALQEYEDVEDVIIEECVGDEYETARLYCCQNCGGGFLQEEMVFGEDTDLCEDCA